MDGQAGGTARLARAVVPGYPHHITQRGNRRQATFFRPEDGRTCLGVVPAACTEHGVDEEMLGRLRRYGRTGRPSGDPGFVTDPERRLCRSRERENKFYVTGIRTGILGILHRNSQDGSRPLMRYPAAGRILRRYTEKVQASVRKPARLRALDMDEGTERKLLSYPLDALPWEAYAYFFEAQFEAGLFYLPYALSHLAEMREGFEHFQGSPLGWVAAYSDTLRDAGLLQETVGAIVAVFDAWLDRFRAAEEREGEPDLPAWRLRLVVENGWQRDIFLRDVFISSLRWRDRAPLARHMLRRWSRVRGKPTWSAHFMDMCARALTSRDLPCDPLGDFHESEELRHLLRLKKVLQEHYASAMSAWENAKVPAWYVAAVKNALLVT